MMAMRPATGRKIAVKRMPIMLRDMMRRHVREEGKRLVDLAECWNVQKRTVYDLFHKQHPISVQYVTAFIEYLGLDEFDALELYVQGAIEQGWPLEPLKEKARV